MGGWQATGSQVASQDEQASARGGVVRAQEVAQEGGGGTQQASMHLREPSELHTWQSLLAHKQSSAAWPTPQKLAVHGMRRKPRMLPSHVSPALLVVPDLDLVVVAARHKQRLGGVEVHAAHGACRQRDMTSEAQACTCSCAA